MGRLPKFDPEAKQRETQENCRQTITENSAYVLMYWLQQSESDAVLDDILTSLNNNKDDLKQLSVCCKVTIKFTNKAVKINRAEDWLIKAIEPILQKIDVYKWSSDLHTEEIDITNLYIARFNCIKVRNTFEQEAEQCLYQALSYSKNSKEVIQVNLLLAQYYEDTSEYNKMKDLLIKSEQFCNKQQDFELYLANVWLLLGHYYFFQFSFHRSRQYLTKAHKQIQLILLKDQLETQESEFINRSLSDCLHYIGRTYNEEYDFKKATGFYIKSQDILEDNQKRNKLTEEQGATAFYHLRLAQILEICQIRDIARDHYEKSRNIFIEFKISQSGLAQVQLALANMIKDDSTLSSQTLEEILKKQEDQIQQSAKDTLLTGYHRGYLLAQLQLFGLYVKKFKINLALLTVWKALTSDEFKKSGGILLLLRFAKKTLLGFFYKIRFILWQKIRSERLLYTCPCSLHQKAKND